MKNILRIAAVAAAFTLNAVYAHGPAAAKHGGTVASASDVGFELVAQPEGATLYIDDHGKPVATQGATGKLTVLNGKEKREVELQPAGENKLDAKGVKLAKGTKAVAAVTLPDKKIITVRFTVK